MTARGEGHVARGGENGIQAFAGFHSTFQAHHEPTVNSCMLKRQGHVYRADGSVVEEQMACE